MLVLRSRLPILALSVLLLGCCCPGLSPHIGHPRALALRSVRLTAPSGPRLCSRKRNPVLEAVDDILTYLTNMGGYTGFTESDLKGDGSSSAPPPELNQKTDLREFGERRAVTSESTITAFVMLLILFPSALGFLFIQLYGAPALFTFASQ